MLMQELPREQGGEFAAAATSGGIGSGFRLVEVAKTFKQHQVLKNASWEVKKGERVGLVGWNGAGKTTQLQIVLGNIEPDSGEIVKARKDLKIAYLNQEFDVDPTHTVREEFASAAAESIRVLKRQEQIQKELEECEEDLDRMGQLLDELNVLSSKAVDLDVGLLEKRIDQAMPELGFGPEDNDRLVASYSGGWQMRMCLGKVLLKDPDVLLLDEPTNHLDLDAIGWLEKYIRGLEIPVVVVSHDREFLDQVCNKIVETEHGETTSYKGNYTDYVRQKDERVAAQWAAWEKQQKEIKAQESIIARLSAGAQSGRASSAEKTLERLRAQLVRKPFVSKQRTFRFPPVEQMGRMVAEMRDVEHSYGGRVLFSGIDLDIERGQRIAIIGPNGAGKSTLLRLLLGREQPSKGKVRVGEHGIKLNYFEQNQAEVLEPGLSCLDTLRKAAPGAQEDQIKALLGRMQFSGAAMDKKVEVLSGGEKARLALAQFMLTDGTLLVLDEPTNHLDIPSKEMLEDAVRSFEGAVIAVSHDRYFLRKIATRILNVENGKLVDYLGDYEYFVEKNDEEAAVVAEKQEKVREIEKSNIKAKSKMSKVEKKRLKKAKAAAFHAASAKAKK